VKAKPQVMDAPNTRAGQWGHKKERGWSVGACCKNQSNKITPGVLAVPGLLCHCSNLLKGLSILGCLQSVGLRTTVSVTSRLVFEYSEIVLLILLAVLCNRTYLDGSWGTLIEFHNIIHVVAH
jgi:hypothetical protein